MEVQCGSESFQGMLGGGGEIDHLTFSVGPGVGAAGASDPGWLPGELLQRCLQLTLDGGMADLKLESGVIGALVFNQKGGPPKLPARSVI